MSDGALPHKVIAGSREVIVGLTGRCCCCSLASGCSYLSRSSSLPSVT
uniref:Uncharacterized protein n=1 Tax=Arundo donax TaxID=35708 RepID=A0A0A9F0I6_ARUDO